MARWTMAIMLALGSVTALRADGPPDNLGISRTSWVTAAPVSQVQVIAGKPGSVNIDFRVAPGFHINSNQPKSELLRPTILKLSPPTDILVGKVKYPQGKDLSFEFVPGETLNVYSGEFRITALVTAARSIPRGTYRVRAVLNYQACDNRQCFPPRDVPVSFDVRVQGTTKSQTRRNNPGQSPHVHR